MRPENFKFGGGSAESILHPVVLVALILAVILLLVLPRKYAVIPLLFITFLVPVGQKIVVSGLHVFVLRIVIVAGLVRFTWGRFTGGFGTFDKLFLFWALFRVSAFVLLFREMGAVVNQLGFLWDCLGAFFLLRFLIQNDKDVELAIKALCVIATILGVTMTYEHLKGVNVFGLVGGVLIPEIRNGHYRAQGPFQHALLAGSFGATLLPLSLWLWVGGKSRILAVAGVVGSTMMTAATTCSTPIMAYLAGLGAVCLWPLRRNMRFILWGLVLTLVGLHIVMKAPVWYLVAHIDVVGGSSSDHRAQLLNLFLTRVSDWWLIGTDSNGDWGLDMWDTCNQYVAEGWTGGMATLVCFLGLIVVSFRRLGAARRAVVGNRKREWYFWLLGSTVFAHVVAFFGISYFDQTRVLWFALLAMIPAAVTPVLAKRRVLRRAPVELPSASLEMAYPGSPFHDSAAEGTYCLGSEAPKSPNP